jgi:hypothetical protein
LAWLEGRDVPQHAWAGGVLDVTAGPRTDRFADPAGVHVFANAPVLAAPAGRGTLTATVRCDGTGQFDAATLYVVADDDWAKLALERSPAGEQMLVSVVTNGVSDDSNHRVVAPPGSAAAVARLRVGVVGGGVFVFHVEEAGRWELLRYFGLARARAEPDAVRLGLSAQSPLGEGCSARFSGLSWSDGVPADLRDGS